MWWRHQFCKISKKSHGTILFDKLFMSIYLFIYLFDKLQDCDEVYLWVDLKATVAVNNILEMSILIILDGYFKCSVIFKNSALYRIKMLFLSRVLLFFIFKLNFLSH